MSAYPDLFHNSRGNSNHHFVLVLRTLGENISQIFFCTIIHLECNVPGLFVCWILLVTGSVHFGWQGRTIRLVMEIEENMKALRDLVTVCLVNVIWFGIRRWWHQGYMFVKIARKPWEGVRGKPGTRLIFSCASISCTDDRMWRAHSLIETPPHKKTIVAWVYHTSNHEILQLGLFGKWRRDEPIDIFPFNASTSSI